MSTTKIRGNTQIMDFSIDLGRLQEGFLSTSTGDWDITNGTKDALITGIKLQPVDDSDVASKWYVDQKAEYGLQWKIGCQFATSTGGVGTYNASGGPAASGAFTSVDFTSSGPFDLGDHTAVVGDRVIVKNQTDKKQNGIYVVTSTGATGGMYRAQDMDGTPANEITIGAAAFVQFGTNYANTGWTLTKPSGYSGTGILVVNVDELIWGQFAGSGALTAGVAIDISGTVVNVKYDNATIKVNSNNQLYVAETSTGSIVNFTEEVQDAVGGILTDTDSINFTYDDFGNTITADVKIDTDGGLEITTGAGGGVGIKNDGIKDTMIDWGTSTGQVSATDMPIADVGNYYSVDNVEAALQQLGAGLAGSFSIKTIDTPLGTDVTATSTGDTVHFAATDGVIAITGNAGTKTVDFTINAASIKDTMIDWGTSTGQVSGGDIPIADVDNYYSTDNVEAALKQIGDGLVGPYSFKTISTPSGTSPVADIVADTLTLLSAGPITIVGNSSADSVTFGIGNAGIKDTMIDWGTSTGQVSAGDIPVLDAGDYFTSTGIEGILQEIGANTPGIAYTEVWAEKPTVVNNTYTVTMAHTPVSNTTLRVYLNGIRQVYTDDYTRAGTTITFVDKLKTNDVVLLDYRYV